jgi:hypothetical protein
MSAKFDPLSDEKIYIGSDIEGQNQINAIVDGVKISSITLTDTRVGEVVPSNQRSITKDYNSLIPLRTDINTLALIDFNTYPFINSADYYKNYLNKEFIQSSISINDNFSSSVLLTDKPISLDNDGILNTKEQGTIEFWVNPLYDTANDPNERYYFDAYVAKSVNTVSYNNSVIKLSEEAEKVISVTLENGDPNIDYFAGGKLELDNSNSIIENHYSNNKSSVTVEGKIYQVISVTIQDDPSQKDYFNDGIISSDKSTIYLGSQLPLNHLNLKIIYKPISGYGNKLNTQIVRLNKKLPKDSSSVVVKYIPKGFQGDRLSIYKDINGVLNFNIFGSGLNYRISTPIYWARNTWHRVQASYKVNSVSGKDEMMLLVDGYQRASETLGGNVVLNNFFTTGAMTIGKSINFNNIKVKDMVNQLYIGSDYSLKHTPYCLIDNLRISNIFRPVYAPYNEIIDPNYSSNLSIVNPVVEDLYTTYLLNFDKLVTKNTDFAFIVANGGNYFDFTLNIFDSFGIVNSSETVKKILEKLIAEFKPANTRAFINYSS